MGLSNVQLQDGLSNIHDMGSSEEWLRVEISGPGESRLTQYIMTKMSWKKLGVRLESAGQGKPHASSSATFTKTETSDENWISKSKSTQVYQSIHCASYFHRQEPQFATALKIPGAFITTGSSPPLVLSPPSRVIASQKHCSGSSSRVFFVVHRKHQLTPPIKSSLVIHP